MRRFLIGLIFLLAATAIPASTSNYYYTESGGGAGTSCGSAHSAAQFNSNADSVQPGDTKHLCGTITIALHQQVSGTSGSPITILFESGASIQLPSCGVDSACLDLGGSSYIVVDGGTPCGWDAATQTSEGMCNGIIEATSNGQGLTTSDGGFGVFANAGSNIEIKNLGIYNIFVPQSSGNSYTGPDPACLRVSVASNFSFHDSFCNNAESGVTVVRSTGSPSGYTTSNYAMYSDVISNVNGGADGVLDGTSSDFYIYGNWVGDYALWQSYSAYHHDGLFFFCDTVCNSFAFLGTFDDWYVYDNTFGGTFDSFPSSAVWRMDGTEQTSALYFFNNVIAPTDVQLGGGSYAGLNAGGTSSLAVYNNTWYVPPGTSGSPNGIPCLSSGSNQPAAVSTAYTAENNLMAGCAQYQYDQTPITFTANDYNVYADTCASGHTCTFWYSPYTFLTFAQWQTVTSSDAHAYYSASTGPNLSSSYVPLSGSPAIGAATNLTSVCSGQPNPGLGALCYDAAGNARPSTGAWDNGAYNSGVATSCVTSYSPGGLAFGNVTEGSTANLTETLSNTGGATCTGSIAVTAGTYFSITGGTCSTSSLSVAASGSCTVIVEFAPGMHAGAVSDSLVFTTNAGSSPDSEMLSGTGTAASNLGGAFGGKLSFGGSLAIP